MEMAMTLTPAAPRTREGASAGGSPDGDWWRQAATYQIYPRSFADGNGDGIGDLVGVLERLDYIARLGVDAVWFSPFYPSALKDGGYDVDDYRDIDPRIGTLEEFDQVIAELHGRGIRVVIDLVPNHSSNRHRWFQEALAAAPGSQARARYVFRDGKGDHGELPPSDWQSFFGGPAWTRVIEADGTPGQWYLHLFTPEQPDWDWSNPEVREDFLATLRFWGDRGVDGFRVDVAMGLAKDLSEPMAPWSDLSAGLPMVGTAGESRYADGQHPLMDRDELADIYAEWRRVFNTYDPPLFAVAEAWVPHHRRGLYASSAGLGQAFNFDLLAAPWSPQAFRTIIDDNIRFARQAGTTTTWVLSNHDVVRHPTRYASDAGAFAMGQLPASVSDAARERGLARARAATLLTMALPGSAYLYQGEELGLPEVLGISKADAQDPWARFEDEVMVAGRDGSRVPLPWSADAPHFGFSAGGAWLPQPTWLADYAVDREAADESSTLSLYREALRLRRELRTSEEFEWVDLGPGVVAFRRENGWTSVTNFTDAPVALPSGRVLLRTDGAAGGDLPVDATAWIVAD
jgi:alpha-glucosidase